MEYNKNQTYLYLENKFFYAETENQAAEYKAELEKLKQTGEVTVAKTAIVIVSYNNKELTKACIESIRKNNLPDNLSNHCCGQRVIG